MSSTQGMSSMQSFNGGPAPKLPAPAFAPRILSITDNSWVGVIQRTMGKAEIKNFS